MTRLVALAAVAALLSLGCTAGPTIVASDPATGFVLYRSGRLERAELAALCDAGLEEILVMDGTARERECRVRDELCPGLRVRYDRAQDADAALSTGFLERFDRWVRDARRHGRAIAFRCWHGWHRTGRLAAWYRIRHEGLGEEAAIAEMLRDGRFMWHHPSLDDQVAALADLAAGRPCDEGDACPTDAPSEPFPTDVCSATP